MNEFDSQLAAAGDALRSLSEGPGIAAAEALQAAFERAGARIEQVLGQAARSGELDFERMADGILRDLARVASEGLASLAGQSAQRSAGAPNVTMNFAAGTDERTVLQNRSAMSAMLARAVSGGGRFL